MKIKDRLWNWGHLEGSHNACTGLKCSMTPEQFAEEYGVKNAFIVSYGGNIQPPFEELAKRLSPLKEIKWSVLGDASTPLPDDELGWASSICDTAKKVNNITGGIVDDFFSPNRIERFTPEVLKKIQTCLHENGLDFWCVLYKNDLEKDIDAHLDCFDGITFWIWDSVDINNIDEITDSILEKANGKPVMLGVYLWDYASKTYMPTDLFKRQLDKYFGLLAEGSISGIVFCSSTLGDAPLETNAVLKEYIKLYGGTDIKE